MSCDAGDDLRNTEPVYPPGKPSPAAHNRRTGTPPPPRPRSVGGIALASAPPDVSNVPGDIYASECNRVTDKPISKLPRSVLWLAGSDSAFIPVKSFWDSGSSNCIASPAYVRSLGYEVPGEPDGHGTMTVTDGSQTKIYGWTYDLRVRPPTHLPSSDKTAGTLVTSLPSMRCLVADISEDLIIGIDYIQLLQGVFTTVNGVDSFRLSTSTEEDAPTVDIPLLNQRPPISTHYSF